MTTAANDWPPPPVNWRDSGWSGLWIAGVILVVDQITKWWVHGTFFESERVYVLPILDITLHYNPGAAWSFLADAGGWQRWFFTALACLVAVALTAWLRRLARGTKPLLVFGLSLILAGAIGNAIDRILLGKVIDFVSVHWFTQAYFPTFNVADAAITVGAGCVLLDSWFEWRQERRSTIKS
jgi:signal peptidase II